ncbi:MAG: NEW3 domain-containing protein [Nitrososphaeria archaeon]
MYIGWVKKSFICLALIVSLIVSQPFSFAVFAQQQGSVHGLVVDENGVFLDGVLVQVYSQNGAFVCSTYTSYGSFNIFLEYGTYTFYFTKIGYAKVLKTVFVQSIDMDLGNITLSKALKLSTTLYVLSASPGDAFTIPFTLSNLGEGFQTVSFFFSVPDGWHARVLDSGREVLSVLVSSGQSLQFQLEISVPIDALADTRYNVTLIASGNVNSSLNFVVFVKSSTVTIFGKIVDEDGFAVGDAKVQALSSNGLLLCETYSDKDGDFNILLPKPYQITLSVYKDGYVQFSRNIVTQESLLNLGNIVLQKIIKLSTSVTSFIVSSGSKLLIPFTVSNFGDKVAFLRLSSNSGGWSTRILSQSGIETSAVMLLPNSNLALQLEVQVPSFFVGEKDIVLTVEGTIASTLKYKIIVNPVSERLLSCDFPGKPSTPGDIVNFKVSLKNVLDCPQRFIFSYILPAGWNISVKTSSGESVSEVMLDGGRSVDLTVSIKVSPETPFGIYNITFTASSNSVSDSIILSVILQKPFSEVLVVASPPYVDVYAGSNARFKLKATNAGSSDELLNLSIEGLPQGLKGWFEDSSKQEITRVYVPAGEFREFYAVISVPKGAKLGSQNFVVNVSNSDLGRKVNLTLNILGFYDITIANQNFYTSLNVGGKSMYSLVVRNAGSQDVTNLKVISGSVPDGFTVTVEPSFFYSLSVDKEVTFTITVQTQSDVNAGNYYIDFTVFSDQTQAKQFTLRVEVLQETSWLIYASVLLLLAIVSLFFIYRKFGRR